MKFGPKVIDFEKNAFRANEFNNHVLSLNQMKTSIVKQITSEP